MQDPSSEVESPTVLRTRLLESVVWFAAFALVPAAAFGLATSPAPVVAALIYGTLAVVHVALLLALRRGFGAWAGPLYIGGYFLLACGVTLLVGGVTASPVFTFVTVTLLAGLTVGRVAGAVVSGASMVFIVAAWLVERRGWFPPPVVAIGPNEDVTTLLTNLLFVALFVFLAVGKLEQSVQRALRAQAGERHRADQALALANLGQFAVAATGEALAARAVDTVREQLGPHEVSVMLRSGTTLRPLADTSGAMQLFGPHLEELAPLWTGGTATLADTEVVPIPGRTGVLGVVLVRTRVRDAERSFLLAVAAMVGSALQRDAADASFRQSQKMEVVGRLAGGVAHDFNNLLTSILGCTSLLEEELEPGSSAAELARDASQAAERAALLTRQLLTFSRKQPFRLEQVELRTVVRSAQPLLQRIVGPSVSLELSLADDAAVVAADRAGLEQVLLNLVINARDAMPEGGQIRIRVSTIGRWVELSVRDTGSGMDAETQARAFEPFFTTKAEGTGLGLGTVRDLVDRSRGSIQLSSQLGEGTEVKIRFPVVTQVTVSPVPTAPTSSELLLLVDDDAAVRGTTLRMLEADGYRVLVAGTVADALELAKHPELALVVADLVMPDGGGRRVRDAVAGRVPVLFISGFDSAGDIPNDALLPKPFTRTVLASRVRAAIDKSRR